jgi:hypothetical protein
MRNNSFVILMVTLMILFITIVFTSRFTDKKELESERVKFLKDSLEIEYYKKELESYPYDHSKIPTDDTIKRNGKPSKSLWR